MKNSPILLTLFACFAFAASTFGQAGLERQVIGLAGNTLQTTSGATLDFTMGEALVSEHQNGKASIAQGFHQIMVAKTTLHASALESALVADVQVFPNPAQDVLQINTDTPIHAALFDLNGRVVLAQTAIETTQNLEISSLPSGTYFLRSITSNGKPVQTFKIQIIH